MQPEVELVSQEESSHSSDNWSDTLQREEHRQPWWMGWHFLPGLFSYNSSCPPFKLTPQIGTLKKDPGKSLDLFVLLSVDTPNNLLSLLITVSFLYCYGCQGLHSDPNNSRKRKSLPRMTNSILLFHTATNPDSFWVPQSQTHHGKHDQPPLGPCSEWGIFEDFILQAASNQPRILQKTSHLFCAHFFPLLTGKNWVKPKASLQSKVQGLTGRFSLQEPATLFFWAGWESCVCSAAHQENEARDSEEPGKQFNGL